VKTANKNFLYSNPILGIAYLLVLLISVALLASPYYKFSLLPIACIIGLVILAQKPQLGYLLIIFLIPLDAYTGLSTRYPNLTVTKLIGFWLILVVSFYFLLKKKETGLYIFKVPIWKWLWLFLVISLISALLSDYRSISFYGIRRLLTAYVFVILTLAIVTYKDLVKRIPFIVVVSNAMASILAIIGYIFKIPSFTIGLGNSAYSLERATGLSIGPNAFAVMILFSLPYIVYVFLTAKRPRSKILSLALLVINLLAVIMSFSRSGALVLILLAILHAVIYRRFLGLKTGDLSCFSSPPSFSP